MQELDLRSVNAELSPLGAEDRIRWAVERFGDKVVLLSSMQKTASVLMHLFHRLRLPNTILFVDTGFHFHSTLQLRDEFMRRYHLNIRTLYPETTPEEQETLHGRKLHLFVDGQKECCKERKEKPFLGYLETTRPAILVSGLRASEGGRRRNLPPMLPDARIAGHTMFQLHPILEWTDGDIERYLEENGVPIHPLHAQSYPSIGCACCTTPVAPGEDPRAGRWRHLKSQESEQPVYCGINFSDGSGI